MSRRQRLSSLALFVGIAGLAAVAHADNFGAVYYDAGTDQLVVTMIYSGTNPKHKFSITWGECKDAADGIGREVVAEVLDAQWQDAARNDFTKTKRFDLTSMPCRPAKLTLRTAPRFYYSLQIPAAPPT